MSDRQKAVTSILPNPSINLVTFLHRCSSFLIHKSSRCDVYGPIVLPHVNNMEIGRYYSYVYLRATREPPYRKMASGFAVAFTIGYHVTWHRRLRYSGYRLATLCG